jgi:hypothetical protein
MSGLGAVMEIYGVHGRAPVGRWLPNFVANAAHFGIDVGWLA